MKHSSTRDHPVELDSGYPVASLRWRPMRTRRGFRAVIFERNIRKQRERRGYTFANRPTLIRET